MEEANMAGIMMPMKDVQDWVLENRKILLEFTLSLLTQTVQENITDFSMK